MNLMTEKEINELCATHRWSGWPGAWCLDCGQEDPRELEEAGYSREELNKLYVRCPNTNSNKFNPYIE